MHHKSLIFKRIIHATRSLTSPVYAGVFVYGRRKQEIAPGDPPTITDRRRPERRAEATIVWSGGTTTRHEVCWPPLGWQNRTEAATVERLRALSRTYPDHQIAARLNAEGLLTRTGKSWTCARIGSMRKQYGIATACPLRARGDGPRGDGLVPVKVAAQRLGVSSSLVHVCVSAGAKIPH